MYLSTTDDIQHKAAPGFEIASSFDAMIDRYVGKLDAMGCPVALTADDGMNDKHLANGDPDVIYLQDWFDRRLGEKKARAFSLVASCRPRISLRSLTLIPMKL